MENKKENKPWKKFDTAFGKLSSARPGDYADDPRSHPDIYMFEKIYNAIDSLNERILDIEMRLERLQDDTLEKGWDRIADIVGVDKRTLQRPKHKKKLLAEEIIEYRYTGDPPRKRVFGLRSGLIQYRHGLRKKRKT
jgi:hypothetical protein